MLLLRNLNDSLAVVITCHRYEEYLPDALHSVLNQSITPNEIIIVDDKPDQLSPTKVEQILNNYLWPNIKYIRTEAGDPLKAREAGYQASTSKYLCFLDADDMLGEHYLREGLNSIISTKAAVIYSDIEYFGQEERTTSFAENIPPNRIDITNFLHVGCITSRETIQTSQAFHHPPISTNYQEDWFFWRKILGLGYQITKQHGIYRVRVHGKNRSQNLLRDVGYYGLRGIEAATITFAIKSENPKRFHIDRQSWPLTQIHAIFYNSVNPPNCPSLSIVSSTDHINHAARVADTDYIFYCNSAIKYPPDICERLLRSMNSTIAGVHNLNYELYDCTMVVSKILKGHPQIPNDLVFPNGERLCYVDI